MRRWWLVPVVALLVLVAGLAVVLDHRTPVAPAPTATATPAPERTPLLPAAAEAAAVPSTQGVLRALQPALANSLIRGKVSFSVLDVLTGQPVLEVNATRPAVPASTAKIATAIAALAVLPADQRLTTRVLAGPAGDVVLMGAGDPTLLAPGERSRDPQTARLADLAAQLRATKRPIRRVVVDDRLFTGPRTGPGWKPVYVSDHDVSPVSALELHGREPSDPAIDTGRQLAALLHVTAPVVRGVAAAGAAELASVSSPPVPSLVETMLMTSDNDLAEALGRHVALATRQPASFEGAAAAVLAALEPFLRRAGVPARSIVLRDASGLSVLDRATPGALARLLVAVAGDPRFGPLLSGLPVAGFDGTLTDRYRKAGTAAAAGQVRAKTGTLNGVSALAGLVRTAGGRLLAFDVTVNGLPEKGSGKAPEALDAVATALARCGCP